MKKSTHISVMILAFVATGCFIGVATYLSGANIYFAIILGATFSILASVTESRRRKKNR